MHLVAMLALRLGWSIENINHSNGANMIFHCLLSPVIYAMPCPECNIMSTRDYFVIKKIKILKGERAVHSP